MGGSLPIPIRRHRPLALQLLEEESHLYPPTHPKAGQIFLEKFHQASGLAKHSDGIHGVPLIGQHAENLPNLSSTYYETFALP